jgi:voltage-gated potassium channel
LALSASIPGWFVRVGGRIIKTLRGSLRSELVLIAVLLVGFSVVGAISFYYVEPTHGLGESFYWSLVTMTTVGYGDVTPKTQQGRVIATVLMFAGVSILALISASIASFLVERRFKEGKGLSQVNSKDHLVVAGWASQGEVVLRNLNVAAPAEMREVVLINEIGEQEIDALTAKYKNVKIRYVHGDPTHDFVLKRANVDQAAVAIVLAGRFGNDITEDAVDSRTIKVVMGLRSFSSDLRVFAEVRSVQNEQHLLRAGADEIISPAEMGANVLANVPLSPALPLLLKELLAFHGNGFQTMDIPSRYVDQPVEELFEHYRKVDAILVGLVSERKNLALDDLLQDTQGSFIDAFIQNQFAHLEQGIEERSRFHVRVNPSNDELIRTGEQAMVIIRQTDEEVTE